MLKRKNKIGKIYNIKLGGIILRGRSKTFKYKNYQYSDEVNQLLAIPLSDYDKNYINEIKQNLDFSHKKRGYEYIIEDLYILVIKYNFTSSQLAKIYSLSVRSIQIWLKELGLNRSLKEAKKVYLERENYTDSDLINNDQIIQIKNLKNKSKNNNLELPQLVIDFLNYLETIKGKSKNTINGYKIDLQLFLRFMKVYKANNIDDSIEFEEIYINDIDEKFINTIKLTDIYAFLSFLEKERNNSTYARARKVATLKSFYKFLFGKAKVITENPTLELESPKISKRHPVYLTLDQSLHLLSSLDKDNINYYRDYCILTLFLNCGLRLSELCSIEINKIKNDTLTIIGKGNKERTIYLNDACIKSISDYLSKRDNSKISEENKKYLFLSIRNTPINKRTVELLVKKHITNAEILDNTYTPHKLRHTAATLMYKHGNVDIRSLQNILGHESISTTQIYTHIDDDKLRAAVRSNPLSKL